MHLVTSNKLVHFARKKMTTNNNSFYVGDIVSGWQTSGMTQIEYAKVNNISIHTLRYWVYKRKKKTQHSEAFVELKSIFKGNDILLRYPNGVELHFPAGISAQSLKSLIYL